MWHVCGMSCGGRAGGTSAPALPLCVSPRNCPVLHAHVPNCPLMARFQLKQSEGASRHGRDRRDGRGSSRSGGHSRSSGSRRSGGPGGQRQARQHVKQYRQKILDELAKKEAEFGQRSVDEFVCSIDYSNQ